MYEKCCLLWRLPAGCTSPEPAPKIKVLGRCRIWYLPVHFRSPLYSATLTTSAHGSGVWPSLPDTAKWLPPCYTPEPGSTGHALPRCTCSEHQQPPAPHAKQSFSMGPAFPYYIKPSPPVPPSSSMHDDVFTMVASAMRDISITQQKLAYNQDLPPIQFQKFNGAPDQFPSSSKDLNALLCLWRTWTMRAKWFACCSFLEMQRRQCPALRLQLIEFIMHWS